MLLFAFVITVIALAGCDRTAGSCPAKAVAVVVRHRQPRDHRLLRHPSRRSSAQKTTYFVNGLGVADGVVAGVAVGLAPGVAVGMAVGEGAGVVPGAWLIGICTLVPPGLGVGARIPEGMPGAAGRNPSGLASVEPVRFGAGPAVAGAVAELFP